MTACTHLLKSFLRDLINNEPLTAPTIIQFQEKKPACRITGEEESENRHLSEQADQFGTSEEDLKLKTASIPNGTSSNRCNYAAANGEIKKKNTFNLLENISNLSEKELHLPLSSNSSVQHTFSIQNDEDHSIKDKTSPSSSEINNVGYSIKEKELELPSNKTDDSTDSGGECSNDTDTETITSETVSDVTLKEEEFSANLIENSSALLAPISNSIENDTQTVEAVNGEVTQGISGGPEASRAAMAYVEDDLVDEMNCATQVVVGFESGSSETGSARLLPTSGKCTGLSYYPGESQSSSSPYVLRIDTGDETKDDVIHSSPWIATTSDSEGNTTDDDNNGGIYKAKCVQLTEADKSTSSLDDMVHEDIDSKTAISSDGSMNRDGEIMDEDCIVFDQDALQNMETERKRIIANQVVRSKRIETWLHEEDHINNEDEDLKAQGQGIVKGDGRALAPPGDAFIALPALVRSEVSPTSDEEGDDEESDQVSTSKDKVSADEERSNILDISRGGGNVESFCSETLSLDMTSLANDQVSSLETVEDYNQEPDSLDFNNEDVKVIDNEIIPIENGIKNEWNSINNANNMENGRASQPLTNGDSVNGNTLSTGSWQEVHGNHVQETIVDREVRLALEREEEFRNEILAAGRKPVEMNTAKSNGLTNGKIPTTNGDKQVPYVKPRIVSEGRNGSSSRDTVFTVENGFKMNGLRNGSVEHISSNSSNSSNDNPLESVIHREIRLQREREEALAYERQMALQMRTKGPPPKAAITENGHKNDWNGKTEEDDYEDEQRFKEPQDTCELELMELTSDSETSHDGGVFRHRRAESMDSLGSAGTPTTASSMSSEPSLPKRQIKVKPLVDEDDERPAYQILKETPIEREIRLAKEREETLRREKGLPSPNGSTSPVEGLMSVNVKKAATAAASSWVRSRTLDLFNPTEQRDVQRRLATSRIQQEIEEHTQRELALRAAGSIRTTSEENVDSKVTRLTELIEKSSSKFSGGSSSLPSTPDSELTDASTASPPPPPNEQQQQQQPPPPPPPTTTTATTTAKPNPNPFVGSKTNTLPHQAGGGGRLFTKSTSSLPSVTNSTMPRRPMCGAGKGVMQKFIASRGKVIPSFATPREKSISTSHLNMHSNGYEASREQLMKEIRAPPPRNFRRGSSTETKIQEELQQMKAREEELRLVRAKTFAMSQPNLLSLIDGDSNNNTDLSDIENGPLRRDKYSSSNPNLLDDSSELPPSKISTKPPVIRKRSALIAQWEEKIQQNCDN